MYYKQEKKKVRTIKTVSLERQLLRYLLKNKICLQRMYGACNNEWFTNEARYFIYKRIKEYYENYKSLLNKEQFSYELQKFFDVQEDGYKIKEYQTEYDICCATEPTQTLELIVSKLQQVDLATDVNDLIVNAYQKLNNGQIEQSADMLRTLSLDLKKIQHKGRILSLHEDVSDWVTEIQNRKYKPQKYTGIPTGFPTFDKKTGGLFKAQLTVVFGLSGKGKSTVMKAIGKNVRKAGFNVLHCGNEQNEFQMRTKYQSLQTGIPYSHFKQGVFTDEQFQEWKKQNAECKVNGGGLYIYEFPQSTDVTMIQRAVAQLKLKGIKIDVIIVDYMDLMAPTHRAFSQNDEQGKVTKDLKQLAINCDCAVITATQAGIQAQKQQMKQRPFLNASDVFGTKQKVHSANCLIGIVNQTATVGVQERSEAQRMIHKLVLCVPKNRDGSIFTFRCKMFVVTGNVVEDTQKDLVGEQIQKQAMQMINDVSDTGELRSAIDVKKIQDIKTNELMSKIEEEIKNMSNQSGLSNSLTEGSGI